MVGKLVIINQAGLMLINETQIIPFVHFQLKVILPSEIGQMKNIEVNAVSKWRKKDLNPDLCKIGGQLTDVKKKETTIIDRLVEA